ncbi:MAG: methylated-DNA--[protein]-cysteine S-methyltransferase [Alphaproteobacteria bacterium]|nr:methylated-DNA--[protein]-cysteine S-methyltransferase [Alphaproteobacteria bacterium]
MTETATFESPVGRLTLHAEDGAIVALDWTDAPVSAPVVPVLREAGEQLAAYFAGHLRDFDLPLSPAGTSHQKQVWQEMSRIPYGALATYGDLATSIGSSARAVGTACGRNPIPVIVPCHRVVAAGGRIGGYSGRGGRDTKRTLLALEGSAPDGDLLDANRGDR